MPDSVMIVVDNSEYSQNQDYLPSRFILQKETLTEIFNIQFVHPDNSVGVVPICQEIENFIQTPTSERFQVESFIANLKLNGNFQLEEVLKRSQIGLLKRQSYENKKLWIFYGCDYENDDFDRVFLIFERNIKKIASKGISISIALFGCGKEALKTLLDTCLSEYIENVTVIEEGDIFAEKALACFGVTEREMNDPELEMAIKLSLEESRKKGESG